LTRIPAAMIATVTQGSCEDFAIFPELKSIRWMYPAAVCTSRPKYATVRGYGNAFIATLVVVLFATLPTNQNMATNRMNDEPQPAVWDAFPTFWVSVFASPSHDAES